MARPMEGSHGWELRAPMKLLVFHNPDAGHEELPPDVLIQTLQRAGHEVVWVEKGAGQLGALLTQPFDVVVVAGGDGSVGAVGRELVGRAIPIAVLPLGTANNIASLVGATTGNLLDRLARGTRIPFDVGVLEEADGTTSRFLEGVGFGAFAEAAAILSAHGDGPLAAEGRDEELKRDRRMLADCARRAEPREYRLEIDGVAHTGAWLLVEITNAGLIGPNLRLSADAVPSDGRLDVVAVGVPDRDALLTYLAAAHPATPSPAFTVYRAERVRLHAPAGCRFHIDGDTLERAESTYLRLGIEPSALRFLVL